VEVLESSSYQDSRQQDELPAGATLLHGLYSIQRYMVRGGFGITYLARDTLDREYVIKECFPGALCCRIAGNVEAMSEEWAPQYDSVLRHFLNEARRVAKLCHPNIVGVHQVFEENNTAYMAMEVVNGDELLTLVEERPERLTSKLLRKILRDALAAIEYIHDMGILHRDISPDNFLLDENDHLTLIDFGAAREHAGKESRALSALLAVKDGYSPHEFYLTDVPQTAASDLYSLGATFYHLVTGEAPPVSQDRVAALAADNPDPYVPLAGGHWEFDRNFLDAIDRSLAVKPQERMSSAREWLDLLSEDVCSAPKFEVFPEGDLSRVISRLVEDTNKQVTQGMPGEAKRAEGPKFGGRKKIENKIDETRPLVDIFGNPVDNIDAWMRDQDRKVKGKPKAVGAAKVKNVKKPQSQSEPQLNPQLNSQPESHPPVVGGGDPGFSIGKLFQACLPGRRTPPSSAINN